MPLAPEWDNAQFQPVTIVLRSIIRDYEPGGGILLELCQNADDAGASLIEFVLDERQHTTSDLLHPRLGGYQGAALLAYNDRPFEERDFRSLRRIGDSGKKDDLESTGKFGKGFNSVYNWTDSPSILSGTSLLILDPHQSWSTGGPVYNFVTNAHHPSMRAQLSAFSSILPVSDSTRPFPGAIIRIPLRRADRTGDTGILPAGKHTTPSDVEDVFRAFADELVKSLLFLRTLNRITLRCGSTLLAQASVVFVPSGARKKRNKHPEKDDVNAAYTRVYVDKLAPSGAKDFRMRIALQRAQAPAAQVEFAVSHTLRAGPPAADLQAWAARNKLFAWTAVAAPLHGAAGFRGSLFNTLPLPIATPHPVHIHGMFSVTSDRVKMHAGGDWTTARDSDAKLGARWNEWLFRECVPATWVRNLEFLRGLGGRGFDGWAFWPAASAEPGTRVLGAVFERVVRANLKLLPTVCGTTAAGSDVLFTLEDVRRYEPAFREAGVPVVVPPPASAAELEQTNPQDLLTMLLPDTLRRDLDTKRDIRGLSRESRMLLLHYAVVDEAFRDIGRCSAPLVPIADGSYQSFHIAERDSAGPVFLPRGEDEVRLFSEHARIVDCDASVLLPETAEILLRNIEDLNAHTGISSWTLDAAARYCEEHVFAPSDADIITRAGAEHAQFVDQLWKWIMKQGQASDSISSSALGGLWLLPLADGEYRKLDSAVPILDVSRNKGIGQFIWRTARQHRIRCALFTGEGGFPDTAVYLKRCGFLGDYEDIDALMGWLVANSAGFVDRLSDAEKGGLLSYLSLLACIGGKWAKAMKDAVASLSIFKISGSSQWISMDGVDSEDQPYTYIGIKDIPVQLRAPRTLFIDIKDPDTARLIGALGAVSCPDPAAIFEGYVVPDIVASQTDAWGGDSLAAIEYALHNFGLLSDHCIAELSRAKIVPVPGPSGTVLRKCPGDTVEPGSAVAGLFFADEHRTPDVPFFTQHRDRLVRLGTVSSITDEVVFERIETYSTSKHPLEDIAEKVQKLLAGCAVPPALPAKLLHTPWLPARPLDGETGLYSPAACRGPRAEKLVRHIMPTAGFHISKAWSSRFSWDQALAPGAVLRQLAAAVAARDDEVIEHLIKMKHITADALPAELRAMRWIPSTSGTYCAPRNVFLDDFSMLAPHFGTLDNRFKWHGMTFFNKIGVERAPSFEQLKELQDMFAAKGAPLEQPDLDVSLAVVKEVGKRYSGPEYSLRDFKAPDIGGNMRNILDLTAGDPGSTQTSRLILNHGVSLETVKQLNLATFKARFLEQLNDPAYEGGVAQVSPKAYIEETLVKCASSSVFREFLANAEDCGATRIGWILDETDDYPTAGLLSEKLAGFHGPALCCYNDGVFSESDFKGITEIGVGTKQDDPSKIGRFGKGALTMYHWTAVPSFISGDYFVIFDPEQSYLPAHPTTGKPRAMMKIEIKDLREKWPEQLQPFEGIEGFTADSISFPGTLFRFPLSGALDPREFLDSYYDEAALSLLFTKNIACVSFRSKSSETATWSVTAAAAAVPGKPHISHLTIAGECFTAAGEAVRSESVWCVVSGRQDVPAKLEKTSKRHRLEAKYGLAALVSAPPEGGLCGKYFISLPLRMGGIPGFPVHLNAHMVPQSDRPSVAIASGEEGSPWNKWILGGTCAARSYLDLVEHLMGTDGADAYRHWPEYKPLESETVSNVLANTFWKLIRSEANCSLYPSDGHTPHVLTMGEAVFNLLETETEREYFSTLLLELGLERIATPSHTVRTGLKELQLASMRSITPGFLMGLFRGSAEYSERLRRVWAAHDYSIEHFNQLLFFIFSSGTALSASLVGCALLPLANLTLGVFQKDTAGQAYLMAKTSEEYDILMVSKSMMVHPRIERWVASRLGAGMSLNVRYFHSDDIKQLYPRLDADGRDSEYKRKWLVRVWAYLRATIRSLPGTERTRLEPLQNVRIYFGRTVGAGSGDWVFVSPSEFDGFACAAILKPSEEVEEETAAVVGSFKGLILLDRSAFPEGRMLEESLQSAKGAYQLLRSIHLLASTDQPPSIEAYITRTVPNSIATLRRIFSPEIISELVESKKFPKAREYLRELPLWPSTGPALLIHQPATRAQLPPHPSLSRTGMTHGDIFVDPTVARQYSEQLAVLGVKPMTIDCFLKDHVKAIPDRRIQKDQIPNFKGLIDILSAVFPEALSNHPLGVDGNGTFQWLNSLYSPDNPIFMAAFRDMRHFLHLDHRHFASWERSPLIQQVTEESFLACARSIEDRAARSDAGDDWPTDARIVFGYLCHEDRYRDQETSRWRPSTWAALSSVAFAPVKTAVDGPRHRALQMAGLRAGRAVARITDAVAPRDMDVSWSQYLVLEIPPSPLVTKHLPAAVPSADTVVGHLLFLWQNRGAVAAEHIPAYVADTAKCYQWLQDLLLSGGDFPVPQGADIWLNAEKSDVRGMTPEEFQASWLPSRVLCIGLEHDLSLLRHVRSFLAPYHTLMKHCDVKTIKTPPISSSKHSVVNHTSLVLNGLQKLREEAWSVDLKIVLEGQEFHAHSVVLCAMSGYWNQELRARIGEANKTHTFPAGSKVKPESVSALLDYMYTGVVSTTELSGVYSEDLHSTIDQLYLSNEWQLDELKKELELSLCKRSSIRPDFIHTIIKCAEYVGATDLLDIYRQYVLINREIVDQLGIVVPSWDWYPAIGDS